MALGRRMCLTERADGAPPAGCRVRDEAPSRRLRRQVSRSACRAASQELEEEATILLLRRVRTLVARRKAARRLGSGVPDPLPTPSVSSPASPRPALLAPDLQELEAQAHYHRDRLALYRARVLTAKPASAARLRELERASAAADARLRHAAGPDATAEKDGDRHGPL